MILLKQLPQCDDISPTEHDMFGSNALTRYNSVSAETKQTVWEGLRFVIVALPGLFS